MRRAAISLAFAILILSFLSSTPQPLTICSDTSAAEGDGFLMLNEISPWPSDGIVWVEFLNPTDEPVSLDGWSVEFLSGYSLTFQENAGAVPPDGIHVLEITGENPLDAEGDGCILKSPDGPVDAIMWGNPPESAFHASLIMFTTETW